MECIVGCLYECNSLIFCEKLTQIPSRALQECTNMNCLMSINEFNEHGIMDTKLKKYKPVYFPPYFEKNNIYQLYSWITLKSENQKSNSPLMKKFQQPPPKDTPF